MLTFFKVLLFITCAFCVLGMGGTLFMAGYSAFLNHADEVQRYAGASFMLGLMAVIAGTPLAMLETTPQATRLRRIKERKERRAAIRG